VVVKTGGTSGFQQLPHAGDGAVVDAPGVQVLPYFIKSGEPVEELQPLDLGQVAAEGLVEVVVGVDQAGIDDAPGGVHHPDSGLTGGSLPRQAMDLSRIRMLAFCRTQSWSSQVTLWAAFLMSRLDMARHLPVSSSVKKNAASVNAEAGKVFFWKCAKSRCESWELPL